MISTVKDCLKERLLRKIRPDKERKARSMKLSEEALQSAQHLLRLNVYDMAILKAYMAMFHSARAILYQDGYQEKGYYAIYVYLKEKHGRSIPLSTLNLLNIHRAQRHESLYGLDFMPAKEDAETALADAKTFVKDIKRVL